MLFRALIISFSIALLSPGSAFSSSIVKGGQALDAKAIINDSYNFLLNREPEMTETEYALYEEVLPMVFDQPDVAILLLETMLADDDPESPAFSYVLANVYYSTERYDLAEKHYKSAIAEYSDFLRAWVNLGILYYTRKNYPEAITCFTKAIELGNQEAQIKGLLGYCLREVNNPLAAEAAFLQAYAGDPHNEDWIEALINLYLDSKQYGRCELLIKELLKLKPESKPYWSLYTSVLLSTNRNVEALTVLETLHKLGISSSDELLLLGDLYAKEKLFPEALAAYRSALMKEPVAGKERLLGYARALVDLKSYREAEKVLSVLTGNNSQQQIEVMQIRAQILHRRKNFDQAILLLNEILDMDPLNGEALLTLGRIYKENKEYSKAWFVIEQARELPDFTFQASVELASLSVINRQFQQAINYLRDAMRINNLPEIESYIQRLEALNSSL